MMLKIYLCDLVYETAATTATAPLNVACIAAYVKEQYASAVDIEIFKYPRELEKAINSTPPDILGLSNYSWNERLDHAFIKMGKRINPNMITVMGGPNIRTDHDAIEKYLSANKLLDYYIPFEGEEPFGNLVEHILGGGDLSKPPLGCARIVEGRLCLTFMDFKKQPKQIDLPSPYLTGILDRFISDPSIIPLFQTNRGCPFHCIYCTWGATAFSRVRTRPLNVVYEEIAYVARKCAKQVAWFFADANFGLLKRDLDIAKKIRQEMNKYGYPKRVWLYNSKDIGERTIEIAEIIDDGIAVIALQSTDPGVLRNCGREEVNFGQIERQIGYYKEKGIEVATDTMIGLPGETAESHLNTLRTVFDLGFGYINMYNVRLLPGSQYESEIDRERYRIETKFRPIVGGYGFYGGQRVFEIEESVRGTKDMSELELEHFAILHWSIYFCWNTDFFKPLLQFAQRHGASPADVLCELCSCESSSLVDIFSTMRRESAAEWFETKEEIILYYERPNHFDEMVNNHVKLNSLWIARVYRDANILSALSSEIVRTINRAIKIEDQETLGTWDDLHRIVNKLICRDPLQEGFIDRDEVRGEALSYVLNDPSLSKEGTVEVEIYRAKEDVEFCDYYLNPGGKEDISIQNYTRFLGHAVRRLTNRIRIVSQQD
jgi:radical SAM superfamily enzyme YgiQ (UPF0313 family)